MAIKTTLLTIFRRGRHKPTRGDAIEFSDSDLHASAQAYDPAKHEAPLTIGHPEDNKPAYGWVEALNYSEADGHLHAAHKDNAAEFTEWVSKGFYKKVSASFYRPDDSANPVPGVYYLRHVAFLGAAPPAVKGLPAPSFAGDDNYITVEFSENETADFSGFAARGIAGVFRRLREWIIEKNGRDEADKIIPQYVTDSDYFDPPQPSGAVNYSEHEDTSVSKPTAQQQTGAAAPAQQAADFAERERTLNEREQAVRAAENKTRRQSAVDFVEKLASGPDKKGRILPKHKNGLVEFLCVIDSVSEPIEFAESDGAEKKKQTPGECIRAILSELPAVIDYAERAPSDTAVPAEFSEVEREARAIAGVTADGK